MSYQKSTVAQTSSLLLCILLGGILSRLFTPQSSFQPALDLISDLDEPDNSGYVCTRPPYVLRMLSYEPFVAHLENFIAPEEAAYLKEVIEPRLSRSKVFDDTGESFLSPERTSSTAFLMQDDPVVECIRQRASEIQGHLFIEDINIQATVYKPGQFYNLHHDCGSEDRVDGDGPLFRTSTIFGILEANCDDCGTDFPYVYLDNYALDDSICEFVECGQDHVTVKAKTGSAVFWRNRLVDGTTDDRMSHAGLPVMNGTKYAINIWSNEAIEA